MTVAISPTAIVAAVAEHAAQRITRRAIRDLQRMPSDLSGEGSGLATVWNEICVQVQHEHSFAWHAYDQTARAVVDALVEELLPHEQAALRLQTDEGIDWDSDDPTERATNPVATDDTTAHLLRDYIYRAAEDWSNTRIRAYLDR
jgi:hypothetical protein